jgi:hypothetical protein
MDLAGSAAYLRHQLALAGRSDPLIAAAAAGQALVDDACAKRAVASAMAE